ncbi:hypothetical protein [Actinomadura hibisca]|uniref:hypothetical protein n=1 Tax=Actinomadura hibisca TaxID=68565 RepID=UPI000836B870|nr:hypothetical protein [Actinomadura hibisca]
MTFELLAWHTDAPLTRTEAAAQEPGELEPHPAVAEFAREFGVLRPEVDIVAPESRYVRVRMTPEQVDEISTETYALARAHGLVCFDPDRELVHNLGPVGVYEGLQLHTGEGLIVIDPDLPLVHDALERLAPANPFTTLVAFGRHFMQASPEGGAFELEYKDSAQNLIYSTRVPDLAEVQRAFQEYATGERGFLDRHDWTTTQTGGAQ